MNKEVVIIAGANGSGKTTFAKQYKNIYHLEFINADEIARELNPNDTKGGELKAGRIFFQRIQRLKEKGESFVLESTLSGLYLKRLIGLLNLEGYKTKIIYIFLAQPEQCIQRVFERVLKGGHNVEVTDIVRRFFRSKSNFWHTYRFLTNHWHIIYNADQQFTEVAAGNGDDFTVSHEEFFYSFMETVEGQQ